MENEVIDPIPNHRLIRDLSVKYRDEMTAGDPERKFCQGSIAAAYLIGAEETLKRVCDIIRESVVPRGLSQSQATTLLRIINHIESMPYEQR